ncbi:MAG: hydrogenase iron-sulfur subunit [Rhodobacterales bacterium]|nr:hydrogenase iron-sulfur subunit [Rhodobacterales bacterium]
MLKVIQTTLQGPLLRAEGLFDHPFGAHWNPMRQLGTLSFFFYWIVAVSGIFVYVFFETSVTGAHGSIEYMTVQQWYFAGVMRSLHRYASDAMVMTTVLHMSREFITDRYRGVRWFTWFTGVPILWFLYGSGISGYWLVWDQLAQYVAIGSMEWLDWLGIFGEPIANNFLTRGSLGDRFFSLLVFMHIFLPLFLLFIMWIHLLKINRPRINPPGGLALGSLLMLIALSLVYPATSHPPADLGTVPTVLGLDWFYMILYPVFDTWGAGMMWAAALGVSMFVAFMPWLPPLRRAKPAEVQLDKCNGCTRCFEDCPFGAISMKPRSDGRPYTQEAVVDPRYCTSCGLCVGSCPVSTPFRKTDQLLSGIEIPGLTLRLLREKVDAAVAGLAPPDPAGKPGVVLFGCDHGADIEQFQDGSVAVVRIPCVGMLAPSFIDYILSRSGAAGVMLSGCRDGDCYHRLGIRWTEDRMDGLRDPYLRERVPRARIRTLWAAPNEPGKIGRGLATFQADLAAAPADIQAGEPADKPAPAA